MGRWGGEGALPSGLVARHSSRVPYPGVRTCNGSGNGARYSERMDHEAEPPALDSFVTDDMACDCARRRGNGSQASLESDVMRRQNLDPKCLQVIGLPISYDKRLLLRGEGGEGS